MLITRKKLVCIVEYNAFTSDFMIVRSKNNSMLELTNKESRFYSQGCVYNQKGKKIAVSERIGGIGGDHVLEVNSNQLPSLSYRRLSLILAKYFFSLLMGKYYRPLPSCNIELTTVLYIGNWFGHYGHFITEGLSRFWNYKTYQYNKIMAMPFVFDKKKIIIKSYQVYMLNIIGISTKHVNVCVQPTVFRKIIIPEQGWILNNSVNIGVRPVYNAIRKYHEKNNYQKRYFISRKQKYFKRIINLKELETVFEKIGFEILYPETMPIDQQLFCYANCEVLASVSGSGLHNSLFARKSTLVIEIGDLRSRNKPMLMQKMATELMGQKFEFIPYTGTNEGLLDCAILNKKMTHILATKEI